MNNEKSQDSIMVTCEEIEVLLNKAITIAHAIVGIPVIAPSYEEKPSSTTIGMLFDRLTAIRDQAQVLVNQLNYISRRL